MHTNIKEKITFYEYNSNPSIVIINDKRHKEIIELGVAIFTPAESDEGTSHVIEHCVASELSEITGNIGCTAYVLHNITYYNFKIKKNALALISKIINTINEPQFIRDSNIYNRESCNVQEENGSRKPGGVVLNEILLKYRNPIYALLSNIPGSLSPGAWSSGVSGGTVEGLLNLNYKKCRAYFYKYYKLRNSCISILGDFTTDERENIIDEFYAPVIKNLDKKDTIHMPEVSNRKIIKRCKVPYVVDDIHDLNASMYSINLKLLRPESKLDYEFYFWMRYTLELSLKAIFPNQIQIVLRNILDYSYICIIYKNKDGKNKILEIIKKLCTSFNVNDYLNLQTNYIWKSIEDQNQNIKNEKALFFLSEAYFENLPILTFLKPIFNAGNVCKQRISKIIEFIQLNEVTVYPKQAKEYYKLLEEFVNSKKSIEYVPEKIDINWDKLKFLDQKSNQQRLNSKKQVCRKRYKNVGIYNYYFEGDFDCIKLYYDISDINEDNIFLLKVSEELFNVNERKKNIECKVESDILPLYDYSQKKHRTIFVLQIKYPKNNIDIMFSKVKEVLYKRLDKSLIQKLLYKFQGQFFETLKSNIMCMMSIRILAHFRISSMHKDLIFGIGNYLRTTKVLNNPSLFYNSCDLQLKTILRNSLQAISVYCSKSFDLESNINRMLYNTMQKEEKKIILYQDDELLLINQGTSYLASGLDISEIDSEVLLKFKALCKLITNIYLIPILREQGIYYGEINLIEDVLVLLIENPKNLKTEEEVLKKISDFIKGNEEEIIFMFSGFYYSYYMDKSDIWSDEDVLLELCKGSFIKKEAIEKYKPLSTDELKLFSKLILEFPRSGKTCFACNRHYLKTDGIDKKKFRMIKLY